MWSSLPPFSPGRSPCDRNHQAAQNPWRLCAVFARLPPTDGLCFMPRVSWEKTTKSAADVYSEAAASVGFWFFSTYSRFMVWRCEKVPGTRWVILLLCRKLNEKQEEMISHHSPWMHQYQEQLESDSKIFDWHFFKMCNEFPSSSQTCDKLQDVSAKEKNNKFHSFSFEAHNICMCLKQWYAAEPWTHTGDMRLSWLIWTRTLN